MSETLVVDASVAIKWLVEEKGTPQAIMLRRHFQFVAPDLLLAECANILWKKTQRGELTSIEAEIAANLLAQGEIALVPMRSLLVSATELAIDLGHPAYDCFYVALALQNNHRLVTADERLLRRIREKSSLMADLCVGLGQIEAPDAK